jgi:hypothetical protein
MHVSSLTGASVTPQYEAHEADASKFYVKQYGGRSKRCRKSKKYSKTKSKSRSRRGGRRSVVCVVLSANLGGKII